MVRFLALPTYGMAAAHAPLPLTRSGVALGAFRATAHSRVARSCPADHPPLSGCGVLRCKAVRTEDTRHGSVYGGLGQAQLGSFAAREVAPGGTILSALDVCQVVVSVELERVSNSICAARRSWEIEQIGA